MSWTFTTSGAAVIKAGANVNADIKISAAHLQKLSDDTEAVINAVTRKDWIAGYSGVTTNFKGILSELTSDMIALRLVCYDMSGYTSRTEAETILDVLRDNITRNLEILKEDKYKEVMD